MKSAQATRLLVQLNGPIFLNFAGPILLVLPPEGTLRSRVYRAIRDLIHQGALAPGDPLPASRSLAESLEIARNTVEVAFDDLRAEGYITSRPGAGRFVAEDIVLDPLTPTPSTRSTPAPVLTAFARRAQKLDLSAATNTKVSIDFRYGHPDLDGRIADDWHHEIAAITNAAPTLDALTYGDPQGHPDLRGAISGYLQRARGIHASAEQIVVVSGSQQGLDLVARLLVEQNDPVAIEDPHYLGARAVFQAAGARLVSCPVDEQGLVIPTQPARLAYVTPSHQFPTGVVMSIQRRLDLLRWANAANAFVIEDDYDSEFRFDGPPLQAIHGLAASNRTIYLGTFSKILFPALRLGYLVVPDSLIDAVRGAKWIADRHSPTVEQLALANYIASGRFERALRRGRVRNMKRRRALVDALARLGIEHTLSGTSAGLHLMATFPELSLSDLDAAIARAADAGIGIYSAARYYLREDRRASLLFGYSTLGERTIERGIETLAPLLR